MQRGVVRKRPLKPLSEFGIQLREKQSLKLEYNLRERQFKKYVKEALALQKKGKASAGEYIMRMLEKRLDNVVYRMGVAETRKQARQFVSHSHILVNGRVVNIPSYLVKVGDVISVKPNSLEKIPFRNAKIRIKKYQPPTWIELVDRENLKAEIKREPTFQDFQITVDLSKIIEFYSRG